MAEPRFALPAETAFVAAGDGLPLRAMFAAGDAPRGLLLFLNGRGDFLEKYAEVYPALGAAGWAVVSCDWRGQGLSGRESGVPGHLRDFEACVDDLGRVVAWGRERAAGGGLGALPMAAMAHSMGGHLLLRWLARGNAVARAVLLAPMAGLAAGPLFRAGVGLWARRMVRSGRGASYALGQGGYTDGRASPARMALLTADARRFADEHDWVAHDPRLAVGGVTWGWIDGALRSIGCLRLEASRVGVPLLMLLAERERLVGNAAALRLARRLPDCEAAVIAGGRHELLREADAVRDIALSRALEFVGRAFG